MFSQRDEEKYILKFFKKETGSLLDIGAYDGQCFSTTRQLILDGWSGIMVEPSPSVFPALETRYEDNNKIVCLQVAVSEFSGKRTFFDSGGDAISSFDKDHVKLWKEKGVKNFKDVEVDSLNIKDFFATVGFDFKFINIDTEGLSLYILERLPYDKLVNLKMICVEFDHKENIILPFVSRHGFRLLHRTAENLILVKS